jgi:hypothetical protein
LALLGGVVLGVLAEVAVFEGLLDVLDVLRTVDLFDLLELGL